MPTPEPNENALRQIAEMLQHPSWGVGMLEDINEIVTRAGYETRTGYYLVGPTLETLADYDVGTDTYMRGANPIDPDIDLDQVLSDGNRGYWKQTGETIHDGHWTTRDRATLFRGEPDTSKVVDGRRVDGFPDSELGAIDTWGRH